MKTNRSTKSYVALLSCVLALGTLITACANEPKQGEANLKKEKRGLSLPQFMIAATCRRKKERLTTTVGPVGSMKRDRSM